MLESAPLVLRFFRGEHWHRADEIVREYIEKQDVVQPNNNFNMSECGKVSVFVFQKSLVL